MKTLLTVAACLAALAVASSASAQAYQWKDASGRTVISDTPPPPSAKGGRAIGGSQPSASGDNSSSGPKNLAEKDMEFKKRQQENKEKSEKLAKEESMAAQRKDACERSKSSLASFESGVRITTQGENGERRFLEDTERQQEIDRARKMVSEYCK